MDEVVKPIKPEKKKPEIVMVFDSICKETDFWQTPQNLKDAISNQIIPFGSLYDPCPSKPTMDGFNRLCSWRENNYINPPFSGKNQLNWGIECVERIISDMDLSQLSLLQIRFDPTASHFKYMMGKCSVIWMPDKRLKYVGAKDSYNFPIAIYQIQKYPPKVPAFQMLRIA